MCTDSLNSNAPKDSLLMNKWFPSTTLWFWPIAAAIILLHFFDYSLDDFACLGILLVICWVAIHGKSRVWAVRSSILLYVIAVLPVMVFPSINRTLMKHKEAYGETFLHGVNAVIQAFLPLTPFMVIASTALFFAFVATAPSSKRWPSVDSEGSAKQQSVSNRQ